MRSHMLRGFRARHKSSPVELTNLADLALILAFTGFLVPQLIQVSTGDLVASTGAPVASELREQVTILLSNTETIHWNRDVISWAELERRIQDVKESRQPPKLFLAGERHVPLGLNIDVRTLLQGADYTEIALKKEP